MNPNRLLHQHDPLTGTERAVSYCARNGVVAVGDNAMISAVINACRRRHIQRFHVRHGAGVNVLATKASSDAA